MKTESTPFILDEQGKPIARVCSKCGEEKPLGQFVRNKNRKYGIRSICLECNRIYFRERRERYLLRHRQRSRDNYWENPEASRATRKSWREQNPEKNAESKRSWRLAHPEKNIEYNHRHLARTANVICTLDGEQLAWLYEVVDYQCIARGQHGGVLTPDHVIPRDPGTHTLDNIQPLCRRHNESKGRTILDYRPEWLKQLVKEKMLELGLVPLTEDEVGQLRQEFLAMPVTKRGPKPSRSR